MNIPFKVKLLTDTAKAPTQENQGDLWDLYADDFDQKVYREAEKNNPDNCNEFEPVTYGEEGHLSQLQEIMFESVKTDEGDQLFDGIGIYCKQWKPLTTFNYNEYSTTIHPQGRILVKTGISLELPKQYNEEKQWCYYLQPYLKGIRESSEVSTYAVADIRPRSGLALKHGITVLNTPGTIDNSYRKEIGVILYNAGHDTYTINRGDKIAQMLIRPLYPSKMEIVDNINDTGRGGYGSTGK